MGPSARNAFLKNGYRSTASQIMSDDKCAESLPPCIELVYSISHCSGTQYNRSCCSDIALQSAVHDQRDQANESIMYIKDAWGT